MYASFLVPGVLCCLFLIQRGGHKLVYATALVVISLGIILAFSRAALGAMAVCVPLYLAFLYRKNLFKAGFILFLALALVLFLTYLSSIFFDNFLEKMLDRLTLAKDYDAGYGGRYSRYLLSLPLILENPLGIGILQIENYFPEPIHNIFISSFLNYGWLAGFAWLSTVILSVAVAVRNYRTTRSPISMLLFFAFLSEILCASLHEGEHWRHLWLFLGLVWGFGGRSLVRAAAPTRRPAPVLRAAPLPAQ
jgi:O-antigen ligase